MVDLGGDGRQVSQDDVSIEIIEIITKIWHILGTINSRVTNIFKTNTEIRIPVLLSHPRDYFLGLEDRRRLGTTDKSRARDPNHALFQMNWKNVESKLQRQLF